LRFDDDNYFICNNLSGYKFWIDIERQKITAHNIEKINTQLLKISFLCPYPKKIKQTSMTFTYSMPNILAIFINDVVLPNYKKNVSKYYSIFFDGLQHISEEEEIRQIEDNVKKLLKNINTTNAVGNRTSTIVLKQKPKVLISYQKMY
jgi:hypothetical protein